MNFYRFVVEAGSILPFTLADMQQVNKEFLFSASSPGSYGDDGEDVRLGLALNHAYSVIKAVEEEDEQGKKHRLVLIR